MADDASEDAVQVVDASGDTTAVPLVPRGRGGARGDRKPKRRKFEPNDPHMEGYEAAIANKLRAANPYEADSDDARRWHEGYTEFIETDGQFAE